MGIAGLILSFLLFCCAFQEKETRSEGFILSSQEGMEGLSSRIREIFPAAKNEVEGMLGLSYKGEVSLHLIRGRDAFQKLTGSLPSDWMAAVALPSKGMMILRVEKLTSLREDVLAGTLKHEYCHLVTGTALKACPLFPLWFSEGLSQWAAGMVFMGKVEELALAEKLNTLLSFYDLEKAFPPERSSISLAYLQSESLVQFMEKRYGRVALQGILALMAGGSEFYPALFRTTGQDFPSLVKEWKESLKKVGFLQILFVKTYPFFILMAVLVLFAFLRRKLKDARIKKRWEEEGDLE